MTTGSFNNQSFDIAVSDTVVRLRYGFREGCSFTTCWVSEFVLVPSSGKKICRSAGIKPWSHFYGGFGIILWACAVRSERKVQFLRECKILTFWLWNKVCLTVWNAHVRVRPNTKQVSTLFNQCKLYFEIQSSSRSLASTTVNGAVILVALVSSVESL